MISDPDYSRGLRAPGPVPGRGAWITVQNIRKATLALEKQLRASLLDSAEKDFCINQLDMVSSYAEALIARFDRNGPPENQSELGDAEATLRFAAKNPVQFKTVDIAGLKSSLEGLRRQPKKGK